ncbi:MAG: 1-acyl-sn-glycerol-3-phosphate acyltransferase [Deferribacteres bacterium]|nr:1-acyl-sn-glycerol-3-phosphate acyltransferase [Deferribacteres bacterium]
MRTVVFWLVCGAIVAVCGPFFLLFSFIDEKKRIPNLMAVFWSWSLLKIAGVKLKVDGEEILKKYPQYVIVANHQSYMDIFTLIWILKKIPHFLAKKELFRIPIFGQCLRAADVIEIDRSDPDRALSAINAALSKGLDRPIAIFPEGTRSVDGRLQPFKKKGLNLLMETGLPFVPLAFYGTREVMPKKSYRVRPHPVCVCVGEPLLVEKSLSPEKKDEIRDILWKKVFELKEKAEKICRLSI